MPLFVLWLHWLTALIVLQLPSHAPLDFQRYLRTRVSFRSETYFFGLRGLC